MNIFTIFVYMCGAFVMFLGIVSILIMMVVDRDSFTLKINKPGKDLK